MKEERTSEDKFVNYAPAMPRLSNDSSRLERLVRTLFRRRGGLRPVAQQTEDVVVDTTEK